MPLILLTEIASRILVAAVDLGWTPPAWRSEAGSEPFTGAETPLTRVVHAIETQALLRTTRAVI